MKILLINPNTLRTPPVPPIGLEYAASALRMQGHDVELLDLCFSAEPLDILARTIARFRPEAAGITVRNTDSVLFQGNEFYLDGIRGLVDVLRTRHRMPVFAGGAALRADPEGIVRYIGADCGVVGLSAESLAACLRKIREGRAGVSCLQGPDRTSSCGRDIGCTDYPRYLREGAVAGFLTHTGCSASCAYCIEADSPVSFREPGDVIAELLRFREKGIDTFHLCDPEFNEDLEYCLDLLELLRRSGVTISWSLFMKPAQQNRKLFRLLAETGAGLVTLSVDSFRKCPLYWSDTEKIIFSARAEGIRVAVDFLTGFPYEDDETIDRSLDFFRRLQPDTVNINTYIRLYRRLKITGIILADPGQREHLIGFQGNEDLIRPVFYNRIPLDVIAGKIRGDSLFRFDAAGEGVNYSRLVK